MIFGFSLIVCGVLIALFPPLLSMIVSGILILLGILTLLIAYEYRNQSRKMSFNTINTIFRY